MIKSAKKIQGFTLIELLVVLAVLAIIVGAVVTAINPALQIKRANDGKVKNDIGQIATAMQSYFTVYQSYPKSSTQLTDSGDLTKWPTPPTGYNAYNMGAKPALCTGDTTTPCTSIEVDGQLKAPKVSTNVLWCWMSDGGVAAEAATCVAP